MPRIEDVSRRMLRLAGMRIDPAANGPFRTSYNNGLSYIRNDDQQIRHRIELPPGGKLVTFSWSHDSSAFAYSVVTDRGTQLWAAPIGQIPVKVAEQLSTVTGGFSWMPDWQDDPLSLGSGEPGRGTQILFDANRPEYSGILWKQIANPHLSGSVVQCP